MKWLITFLFLFTIVNAEEITTGNLLPNAGDVVDWGSNSTDQINPGNSGYVNNGDVIIGELKENGDSIEIIKYNSDNISISKKDIQFIHKICWVKEL